MVCVRDLVVLDRAVGTESWLPRTMGIDLGDVANCLRPSFSEHHPRSRVQELRVLDETEQACGLVPCPQVVFVHGHNGGSLTCTAAVDWENGRKRET